MPVPSSREVYREEDVARKWQLIVECNESQCGTPVHISEISMQIGDLYHVWEWSRIYNQCVYDVSKRYSVQVQGYTLSIISPAKCEMDVLEHAPTVDSCIESVRHGLQAMTRGCRGSVIQCFVRLD